MNLPTAASACREDTDCSSGSPCGAVGHAHPDPVQGIQQYAALCTTIPIGMCCMKLQSIWHYIESKEENALVYICIIYEKHIYIVIYNALHA